MAGNSRNILGAKRGAYWNDSTNKMTFLYFQPILIGETPTWPHIQELQQTHITQTIFDFTVYIHNTISFPQALPSKKKTSSQQVHPYHTPPCFTQLPPSSFFSFPGSGYLDFLQSSWRQMAPVVPTFNDCPRCCGTRSPWQSCSTSGLLWGNKSASTTFIQTGHKYISRVYSAHWCTCILVVLPNSDV